MFLLEFINLPNDLSTLEYDNFVQVYGASRVNYKDMKNYPTILKKSFDKFQLFEYAKGSGKLPDSLETYLIYTKKHVAYRFETGQHFQVVGNLAPTSLNNWVNDYAWLPEDTVGFARYEYNKL